MSEASRETPKKANAPTLDGVDVPRAVPDVAGLSLRDAALAYAAAGFKVFPLAAGTKVPFRHSRGCLDASSDLEQVERWWSEHPHANIGLATGPGSGVIALDLDEKDGKHGIAECLKLEAELGALPRGPLQETPSGGQHRLFAYPERTTVPSSNGELADGFDCKAAGGYIVVAPSVIDGRAYRWQRRGELVQLPPAWLERLASSDSERTNGKRPSGRRRHTRARPCPICDGYPGLPQGKGVRCHGFVSADGAWANCSREELAGAIPKNKNHTFAHALHGPCRCGQDHGPPNVPPSIDLSDQLDDIADNILAAIQKANEPPELFARDGIVRIRRDEKGRPAIVELHDAALLDVIARDARFYKPGRKGPINASPTKTLAQVAAARVQRTDGALPPLRGISEVPVLRADGCIVDEPGYDAPSMLVYAPPDDFALPVVSMEPSESELEQAVKVLVEPFADFPFDGEASRAHALGLLLTLSLRELFGLAPMFVVDAPAPGTGKGLLADTVAVAATGRPAPKYPVTGERDDAEMRKRIMSLLLEGAGLAVVDNVEQPLGSASLAALLTAERWRDRLLGASRTVELENRCVVVVTGNNVQLLGNLARRAAWIRLDAQLARPWQREAGKFRHADLLGWVREHRGELIAAAFTLGRAWIAAGRPGPDATVPQLGSFESWRSVIGGVLRVAGIPDFLANQAELYDLADESTPAWAAFFAAWHERFGDRELAVREIVDELTDLHSSPLRDALPAELNSNPEKDPRFGHKLGNALHSLREKRYITGDATLKITLGEKSAHAKIRRWRVVSC